MEASSPSLEMTVKEVIERWPAAGPVLARLGIDQCCGGAHPLGFAAKAHGLDEAAVLAEVRAAAGSARAG